jgi:hypothetical protein
MTSIEFTRARDTEDYQRRTVTNLVAAALVTFLMISGYWIVSALAG